MDAQSLLVLIIVINEKIFLGDLIKVISHRALAYPVGVKDSTLTSRAVILVHPKIFLRNKL